MPVSATYGVSVTPPRDANIGAYELTFVASARAGQGEPVSASTLVALAPPANSAAMALDAGCGTSPLFDSYHRLTPNDMWDGVRTYGWIDTRPQCRDRGGPDALLRDFVAATRPATLRLVVPPGVHDTYALIGDPSFLANPVTISSGDQALARTGTPLPAGDFAWLKFEIDGGAHGRTVDLTFSGEPDMYWIVDALVMSAG
ncbi:hypothetical protein ABN034_15990 [Actinopolymorpha sp. B11F2]|uniref:hypothetical protein n=1 Tax=Actinopolymorpha sp. B11F2 TaxID=3160862 RepID=UPI0032E4FC9A